MQVFEVITLLIGVLVKGAGILGLLAAVYFLVEEICLSFTASRKN